MEKMFLGHVPEDVVTKILMQIPLKSILQYKSVCKTWLSLISNPDFVKSHLDRAIIASRINPTLLHILHVSPDHPDFTRRFATHLANTAVHYDCIVKPRLLKDYQVVGSYNGIICLDNRYSGLVYLWNPTIGKCMKILTPPECESSDTVVKTGFGYDHVSDDFRVVRIAFVVGSGIYIPIVQVYSTNADSWKEFQPLIPGSHWEYTGSNVVVNGVMYFDAGNKLVSFHLHTEVFGLVPFPNSIQRKISSVLDFKGSVAMFFKSRSGTDLWTLDYVSGQASWSVEFDCNINPEMDPEMSIHSYVGAGHFFGSNFVGHVFFNFLYNYKKRVTKYYGLGEENLLGETFKYTRTLVSLNRFEQVL